MILVTGATGLIGSHLLYKLMSEGNRVRIIVRDVKRVDLIHKIFNYYCSNKEAKEYIERIEIKKGDLLDIQSVEDSVNGVENIYHCAAKVSFDPSERDQMITNNSAMTANIINCGLAYNVKKVVHVSSTSVFNVTVEGGIIDEGVVYDDFRKLSGYGISKLESEIEAWRGEAEGLEVVIVNPAIVLGPGNWGESSTGLIEKCYKGLLFYTEGVNAYVDVRDVAEIMVYLMNSDIRGERFILASENITFKSFFQQVSEALGKSAPPYKANRWMGELVWRLERVKSLITRVPPLITKETVTTAFSTKYYSSDKIIKTIGFRFRPLSETIEWTCNHYLNDISKNK